MLINLLSITNLLLRVQIILNLLLSPLGLLPNVELLPAGLIPISHSRHPRELTWLPVQHLTSDVSFREANANDIRSLCMLPSGMKPGM